MSLELTVDKALVLQTLLNTKDKLGIKDVTFAITKLGDESFNFIVLGDTYDNKVITVNWNILIEELLTNNLNDFIYKILEQIKINK